MTRSPSFGSLARPLAALALLLGVVLQGAPDVAQAAGQPDYTVKISTPRTKITPGSQVEFTIDVSRKTAEGSDGTLEVIFNPAFTNVGPKQYDISGESTDNGRHLTFRTTMTAPATTGEYGVFAKLTLRNNVDRTDLDNFDAKQWQVVNVVVSPRTSTSVLRDPRQHCLGC